MNRELIERLIERVGPITWVTAEIEGLPRGWFLLETNPLPPGEDRLMVLADLYHSEYVNVTGGKLYHSRKCRSLTHELPPVYKLALDSLEEVTFCVGIWPGDPAVLGGQPVAIALDPPITYRHYPDHPHLNQALFSPSGMAVPDSLCYIDHPSTLGTNDYHRLARAIAQICIWLFRHQVWLETRKISRPGRWIGPSAPPLNSMFHVLRLDPEGQCWCGNAARYSRCHWTQDFANLRTFVKDQRPGLTDAAVEDHIYRWRRQVLAAASGFWRLRECLLKQRR